MVQAARTHRRPRLRRRGTGPGVPVVHGHVGAAPAALKADVRGCGTDAARDDDAPGEDGAKHGMLAGTLRAPATTMPTVKSDRTTPATTLAGVGPSSANSCPLLVSRPTRQVTALNPVKIVANRARKSNAVDLPSKTRALRVSRRRGTHPGAAGARRMGPASEPPAKQSTRGASLAMSLRLRAPRCAAHARRGAGPGAEAAAAGVRRRRDASARTAARRGRAAAFASARPCSTTTRRSTRRRTSRTPRRAQRHPSGALRSR